jgi:hypothetical protein
MGRLERSGKRMDGECKQSTSLTRTSRESHRNHTRIAPEHVLLLCHFDYLVDISSIR